jgi:ABC-type transporter Mla subunit MlaD
VRIPGSRLAAVVVISSVALSACGTGDSDEVLAAARRESRDALEQIRELEKRTAELTDELGALRRGGDDLEARLESLAKKLDGKADRLQAGIANAKSSASSASATAADALGGASEAAREISVLTNRLNYHLRNHGGG